jgi:predicted metal-dependent hydrolase
VPDGSAFSDSVVQTIAQKACVRALRREAEDELPGRTRQIANQHGFKFRSLQIKQLKGRWGSCTHRQEIVLNCYLMQLPWELIDYVILHELVHTKIMAHGPKFWAEMAQYIDDLPRIRKLMREHRPTVTILSPQEGLDTSV